LSKKIIWILVSLLFLPGFAMGKEVLPLNDFIKAAVMTHPRYQISAKKYLIALESSKSEKSIEDWNLIASAFFQESAPAPVSGFSADYQKMIGYTVGVDRYFAQTGTNLKLEHSNSRTEADYPPVTIPGMGTFSFFPDSPYYVSSLSLTVTQPLLRNAFGLHKKNKIKISGFSLELAHIKLAEDWEDFIAFLRDEYLNWQSCHKNLKIYQDEIKTVQDQLNLVKRQLRYGLSEDLDLIQIRQKLQAYKITLETAKMSCETQARRILKIMGKANVNSGNIIPEESFKVSSLFPEKTAVSYLTENSNLKRTTDLIASIQGKNLETKKDKELADVTLVGELRPNAFASKFSESLSKIGDYSEYTISLNASRTLFNQKAEAEAKKAGEEYEKTIKQNQDTLLNAEIALSTLYTNLKYMEKIIELNKKNLSLARERLALEKKKFNQGRSSIFFVLQAEDEALQAQSRANETVFSREKIINQIKSFTDRYLIEYKDVLKL
jgi:outer membrane protein TolC